MRFPRRCGATFASGSVVLVVALSCLPPAQVAAGEPVTLEVRPLMGGRFESGGWAALQVSVVNDGPPVQAYLTADHQSGTVQRLVELPAGARKTLALYVRPAGFSRRIPVRLVSTDGAVLAEAAAEMRSLEHGGRHVGIVGDGDGHLAPQLFPQVDQSSSGGEAIALGTFDIPERPEPLAGLEALVWAADSSQLTTGQRRSIERWIASGGQLVVLGGVDWQSRTAAFEALLPLEDLRAVDAVPVDPLAEWAGADPIESPLTISVGEPRQGAASLISFDSEAGEVAGDSLVSSVPLGAGRVTFVGADMAAEVFRTWPGAPELWTRLLPQTHLVEEFFGVAPEHERAMAFVGAVGSIPALQVPPAELLLFVIVAYIVLIGPVNYLVLRRLDRRELAWITAPVLVVVFSAASYGIGGLMKGSEIVLNEIAIVRAASGASTASVETYAGLFSPSRASYDLTVDADALITALGSGNAFDAQGRPITPRADVVQGDPAHLRSLDIGVYAMESIRADAVIDYVPALEVTWHVIERGIAGTVRNSGEEPLEDVAVVAGGIAELVGDLSPGDSGDFELRSGGFQHDPPSAQVYGTGNFGAPADAAEWLRRQVIDGVTGHGFLPFGPEGPIQGLGPESGPFVLGWRQGESPVQVDVDGQRIDRYSQTLEIVSGTPAYRPGSITLRPGQVTASVVATDGDVTIQQAWMTATIVEGWAEYRLGLPLELARLTPETVEIVAGADPGMVLAGEEFGAGFFPPGYSISAYDLEAGEWVELGDLAVATTFELENPTRYLDDTGQLRVRVANSQPLGAPPGGVPEVSVYVSAAVTGVLP